MKPTQAAANPNQCPNLNISGITEVIDINAAVKNTAVIKGFRLRTNMNSGESAVPISVQMTTAPARA